MDEEDAIEWKGSPTGAFSFASAWSMVCTHRAQWPWARLVWHKLIPKSYSFLCWKILWRRIATLDKVQLYHPEIDTDCRFCRMQTETVDHLFCACPFTRSLWRSCCVALHIVYDPGDLNLEMIVTRLPQILGTSRRGLLARLALLTWIFSVWEERNARMFDLRSRSRNQIEAIIACRVRDIWRAHNLEHDDLTEWLLVWCVGEVFEPP